jgi:DNA polymerase III delta prime subunit
MINLSDIFGQDTAINWLSGTYAENRLPHGLIFSGPTGVGKATAARALAAVFLCEKPKPGNPPLPCGKCPSCTIFATDNHPDLHIIYKELIRLTKPDSVAKDLAVDVMRDYLLIPAGRKPNMGRGKVFIVEQADLMNAQAQNACLKPLPDRPLWLSSRVSGPQRARKARPEQNRCRRRRFFHRRLAGPCPSLARRRHHPPRPRLAQTPRCPDRRRGHR